MMEKENCTSITTDTCGCVLEDLFKHSFSSLNFSEKQRIISQGRPTPNLTFMSVVSKDKKKTYSRHFRECWYTEIRWLCGCKVLKKLFCWPCILFCAESIVWNKTGVSDLNNFQNLKRRHEATSGHISAAMALIKFGKTRIEFCLSQAFKNEVQKFNENVKKNRHILSRLIDAVCYLGLQELAFRGHNEKADSDNKGNYIELLHLLSQQDEKLQHHLQTSKTFSGTSNDIQNDLIQSVCIFMTDEIKKEIKASSFIALIMDETTDVSNITQLSTVFRYISPEGNVQERFLKFENVSQDRTASRLAELVFKYIEDFECGEKIVAQTYDGAAVMAGEHNGVQRLIREKYDQAIFVHCYAHKLNLVLKQSVDHIRECKVFFQTLSGFASFFSKSSKRSAALDEVVKRRFPTAAPTRWKYNSRLVEVVSAIRSELVELYKQMASNTGDWDGETRACARGFQYSLEEFDFNFLLNIFSRILPRADILFDILQKRMYDIKFCLSKIEDFKAFLTGLRNDFEVIWTDTESKVPNTEKKRQRITNIAEDSVSSYRRLYYEIVDVILQNITDRFSNISKLGFLSLLDHTKYGEYSNKFPETAFQSLLRIYGRHFEVPKLKAELSVLYSSNEFSKLPIYKLHEYLQISGIASAMQEVAKLSKLILTIPATSASVEASFSGLKRIKTYLRSTQSQERLSGLSLISIEKKLLKNLKTDPAFYDKIIDIFSRKNRRIELNYK